LFLWRRALFFGAREFPFFSLISGSSVRSSFENKKNGRDCAALRFLV